MSILISQLIPLFPLVFIGLFSTSVSLFLLKIIWSSWQIKKKSLDKAHHPFMIKILQKLGTEGTCLNRMEAILDELTVMSFSIVIRLWVAMALRGLSLHTGRVGTALCCACVTAAMPQGPGNLVHPAPWWWGWPSSESEALAQQARKVRRIAAR